MLSLQCQACQAQRPKLQLLQRKTPKFFAHTLVMEDASRFKRMPEVYFATQIWVRKEFCGLPYYEATISADHDDPEVDLSRLERALVYLNRASVKWAKYLCEWDDPIAELEHFRATGYHLSSLQMFIQHFISHLRSIF